MKEKYKKSRKYLSQQIKDEKLEEELLKASDKFVIEKTKKEEQENNENALVVIKSPTKKEEMKIIISTQEKEGSFILIDVIRMKLDIPSSETIPIAVKKFIKSEKLKEIDDSKLFDTAVTIAYLRTMLSDYSNQWENNIEQARKYIKEQINDEDLVDEILKASEKLVKYFYKDFT